MPKGLLLVLTVVLLTGATTAGAVAQEATPVASPAVPDPSECRVEPRPLGDYRTLVGTPIPATPATFSAPNGDPAAPAVVEAVVATVRELVACSNAQDLPRVAALYTDAGFAEDFVGIAEDDLAFVAAPPTPLSPGERLRLIAVQDVIELADGRIGAVVVTTQVPYGERDDYFLFAEAGGRYLVDFFVDEYDRPSAGTPTP